jgi:hypothetical protein
MVSSSLPWTWWGTDLPGYRPYPRKYATYAQFDYASLPPLPNPGSAFSWLRDAVPIPADQSIASGPTPAAVVKDLVGVDVPLPPDFELFITTPALSERVRSSTACWIDVAGFRVSADEWLVLFLRDQQDCLFWLLDVLPGVGHRVVVGDPTALAEWRDSDEPRVSDWRGPLDDLAVCAATFDEFMQRFWIENEIWWRLTMPDSQPALTTAQRAYAEHYIS